jgi:transposase
MFTRARRDLILELLGAGTSRRAAARAAGVHHTTLVKWLRRGEQARHPDSLFRRFRDDVLDAEAHPKMRAIRAAHARAADDPAGGSVISLRVDW